MDNRMPTFLLIGAAKSGTTSLYEYLGEHPDVFTSPLKEPNFFAFEGQTVNFQGPGDQRCNTLSVTHLSVYEQLFEATGNAIACGEASPSYLHYPDAPHRIRRHIPDVRLIAILRNPVERAYSNYLMMRLSGREPYTDFASALEREAQRVEAGWSYFWRYKQLGFYHEQLSRYYECFDDDQILILLYDDLVENPRRVVSKAFRFLNVDDRFTPNISVHHNPSGIPRFRWIRSIMQEGSPLRLAARHLLPSTLRTALGGSIHRWNLKRPPMSLTTRQMLVELYRDDVLQLQDLIQRNLTHWLET